MSGNLQRILFLILTITSLHAGAQDKLRVAVFDPSISGSTLDEGHGVMVREMVSATLVNTGQYTIIERSLIEKIIKEQKFSNSGMVSESQVSELGKLAGANKVVLSVMSGVGKQAMLSLKMIDVISANIESQQTKLVELTEILNVITPMTLKLVNISGAPEQPTVSGERKSAIGSMLGAGIGALGNATKPQKEPRAEPAPAISVSPNEARLYFQGYTASQNPEVTIYVDGKKVGEGDLNNGFDLCFETSGTTHTVKTEWSKGVAEQSFSIKTSKSNEFIFEYIKTGFGYGLRIK